MLVMVNNVYVMASRDLSICEIYNVSAFKSSFHLRATFVLLRISFGTRTIKYKSEAFQ